MHSFSAKLVPVVVLVLVFGLVCVAPVDTNAQGPSVAIVAPSGPIGTKVSVSVCGMTPGNTIAAGNITFNGQPWNTRDLPIDSSGCFCATELIVPVAPVGPNSVVVSDGNIVATGVFTVTQPNVVISPTSGFKGQVLTVTGSGWLSHSIVNVTFQGLTMKVLTSDENGSFQTEFKVPITAAASNIVSARDHIGNVGPSALYTLQGAGLEVDPLSGLPGINVLLTGWGFEPFSAVEHVWIGSFPIPVHGLNTNEMGAFSVQFTVPNLAVGGHTVGATSGGQTLDTCFSILTPDDGISMGDDYVTPMEVALSSISHQLVRVWGYENGQWMMYDPLDPLGCTLEGLVNGRAYWIKVNSDCRLIFRDLYTGWNNIGW